MPRRGSGDPDQRRSVFFDTNAWLHGGRARAALAAGEVPEPGGDRDRRITERALSDPSLIVHTSEWQLSGLRHGLVRDYGWAPDRAGAWADEVRRLVLANSGEVVRALHGSEVFRAPDVSNDDAHILTAAILTGSSFLVTADAQFLRAASVATLEEGMFYAFPSLRADRVLAGVHPIYFEDTAMRRAGWHRQESQQQQSVAGTDLDPASPPPPVQTPPHSTVADVTAQLRASRLSREAGAAAEQPPSEPRAPGRPSAATLPGAEQRRRREAEQRRRQGESEKRRTGPSIGSS